MGDSLGGELTELFDEVHEVELFDGDRRWTVVRPGPEDCITVRSRLWAWPREAVRVVDLHDGIFLARFPYDGEDPRWVRMRVNGLHTESYGGQNVVTGLVAPKRLVTLSANACARAENDGSAASSRLAVM
jgi:hypothetical protein